MNKIAFCDNFVAAACQYPSFVTLDHAEAVVDYFYLLHHQNKIHNLTGYKTIEEYVIHLFLDTLHLLQEIEFTNFSSFTDIGTGAGVPGMIMKILYPEVNACLIEATQKKAAFLREVSAHYGFKDCHILADRAETIAKEEEWREKSDLVVARALGSLSVALELTCPFASVGGWVVLPRGSRNDEFEESKADKSLGCRLEKELHYSLPGRDKQYRLLFYKKIEETNEKYPRKPGQIKKRPL